MAWWVSSVAVPVGVSFLTTVVTGVTVGPRLAARAKRIQAAHDGRDQFGEKVLDLLALCGNLEGLTEPVIVSEGLRGERDRWVEQVGEATAWLVDHWQRFALTYVDLAGMAGLVARYAAAVRGVWLSERSLGDRVRLMRELTEPVQTMYFARRWRVVRSLVPARATLEKTLAQLGDSESPGDPASVPAVTPEEFSQMVELAGAYHDEAAACAKAGCFRAGCVMIAAALEAGLLALVWAWGDDLRSRGVWPLEREKDPSRGWKKSPPEAWGLAELVRLARRAGWLPQVGEVAPEDALTEAQINELLGFVAEARNLAAHPGRYMRKLRRMPGLEMSREVYETAYKIVLTCFDVTYETVLKAAPGDSVPPIADERE